MLFPDFFPRLQTRAWARYGEHVTERQFKDWREDELLPGPAAPVGRGRGRCPDRHWPLASYRRALRICRYKSWGARRQSQWWLGFWISGESVSSDRIRIALQREASIERRNNRSLIESNRWRNRTFSTVSEAERGGMSGHSSVSGLLALFRIEPDQYRRMIASELDDDPTEVQSLGRQIGRTQFNLSEDEIAELDSTTNVDDYVRALRQGRLSERIVHPSTFIDGLDDSDVQACAEILKLQTLMFYYGYAIMWIMQVPSPEQLARYVLGFGAFRAEALRTRIGRLIGNAYAIAADLAEGRARSWRLNGAIAKELELRTIIQANASEFRPNLLRFFDLQGTENEARSDQGE